MSLSRGFPPLTAVLLVALSGLARADLGLHSGVADVVVADDMGDGGACFNPVQSEVATGCVVEFENAGSEDPGSWRIGLDREVEYLGVAVDANDAAPEGAPLLPDGGLVIPLRGQSVPVPVWDLLHDDPDRGTYVPIAPGFAVRLNRTGVHLAHYGPETTDLESGVQPRTKTISWTEGDAAEGGGVQYDRIILPSAVFDEGPDQHTDALLGYGPYMFVSNRVDEPLILQSMSSASELQRTLTPNVTYGFRLDSLEIAQNVSDLGTRPVAALEPAISSGATMDVPLPPARLWIELATIEPLPLGSIEDRDAPPATAGPDSTHPTTTAKEAAERHSTPESWSALAGLAASAAVGAVLRIVLALYRRIAHPDLLQNPSRAAVYDVVRTRNGIRVRDLAHVLDLDRTTIEYHIRQLERGSYVASRRVGRDTRVYLSSEQPRGSQAAERSAAVLHPISKSILAATAVEGGATRGEIARATGIPRSTVNWHVRRLLGLSLVAESPVGRLSQESQRVAPPGRDGAAAG